MARFKLTELPESHHFSPSDHGHDLRVFHQRHTWASEGVWSYLEVNAYITHALDICMFHVFASRGQGTERKPVLDRSYVATDATEPMVQREAIALFDEHHAWLEKGKLDEPVLAIEVPIRTTKDTVQYTAVQTQFRDDTVRLVFTNDSGQGTMLEWPERDALKFIRLVSSALENAAEQRHAIASG